MARVKLKRAESPKSSIAQGNALGIYRPMSIAPCKGNFLWLNRVALTGRWI